MTNVLTEKALNRIERRRAKKERRLQVRPKFDQALLPEGIQVRYRLFNQDGARRIVIAAVIDIKDNVPLATGHAICNPTDEYIEERGMLIAEGRAIKRWYMRNASNVRSSEQI